LPAARGAGRGFGYLALPAGIATVGALRDHLAARGAAVVGAGDDEEPAVAVNQQMVGLDAPVKDGDEVAFFPPVTGG
jgi:molybdopterin synthase sulfur carrier subunit